MSGAKRQFRRSSSLQQYVLERLRGAEGCRVLVAGIADAFEVRREDGGERIRVVALHGQSAAAFRPIGGEGCDEQMAAVSYRACGLRDIGVALCRVGQEVEHGAVVPERVMRLRQIERGDVADAIGQARIRSG